MFGFLTAVNFLTTLPWLSHRDVTAADVARSFSYFPLVGAVLGLAAAVLDMAARQLFGITTTSVLVLALLVVVTGALHLDGFIDSCDGLFGGREPGRRLEIMRDSRIGSFGAVAVCMLLIAKFAALVSLPIAWRLPVLVVFPALGRWAMVYATVAFPAGRRDGLGNSMKAELSRSQLLIATLLMIAIAVAALGARGLIALVIVAIVTYLVARLILRKIPGLTGDSYGAINEVAEIVILLGMPLLMALPLPQGLDLLFRLG